MSTQTTTLHLVDCNVAPCSVAEHPRRTTAAGRLPAHIAAAVWRGDEIGTLFTAVISSGNSALDHEFPGGG